MSSEDALKRQTLKRPLEWVCGCGVTNVRKTKCTECQNARPPLKRNKNTPESASSEPLGDSGTPTPSTNRSPGYGTVEEGLKALSGKKRESRKFGVGDRMFLWENENGDMQHYPCRVIEKDGSRVKVRFLDGHAPPTGEEYEHANFEEDEVFSVFDDQALGSSGGRDGDRGGDLGGGDNGNGDRGAGRGAVSGIGCGGGGEGGRGGGGMAKAQAKAKAEAEAEAEVATKAEAQAEVEAQVETQAEA
eukprot:CAMPEP_0198230280 /NCGR_PEP_ID=MMETSP1445-20131203/114581_1 /TAXON_ID=36898 /ORGANISM="Pyramimonas sp., Strain CCMP2087" /LENGTH=245 /DNA_ID=CAMNT_0043910811 /DNA_START=768 /DNA_END=1506 /DNA_ORIENTATION=-